MVIPASSILTTELVRSKKVESFGAHRIRGERKEEKSPDN